MSFGFIEPLSLSEHRALHKVNMNILAFAHQIKLCFLVASSVTINDLIDLSYFDPKFMFPRE